MYIYGLDLSLTNTGVTIVDEISNEIVYIGSIKTNKVIFNKLPEETKNPTKLKHHYDEITELIKQYPPSVAVIEKGFTRFNTATQVIYRVHGVYNLAFAGVPNVYYPPKTVKEAIYKGTAEKVEIKNILEKRLDIAFANEDESDSCAVAFTYLIKNGLNWDRPKAYTKKELEALKKPVDGSRKPRKTRRKSTSKEVTDKDIDDIFSKL